MLYFFIVAELRCNYMILNLITFDPQFEFDSH